MNGVNTDGKIQRDNFNLEFQRIVGDSFCKVIGLGRSGFSSV
jgi:hypothetical protein